MRRGNMMILALIACAMLALVLVTGAELAGLRGAARGDEIGGLQLAQLHRTALADTLDELNASGAALSVGRVLLADEPTSGQRRLVTVEKVEGRTVWLESASSLADGVAGCMVCGFLRCRWRRALHLRAQSRRFTTMCSAMCRGAGWNIMRRRIWSSSATTN